MARAVQSLRTAGRSYRSNELQEKIAFLQRILDKDSVYYQGSDDLLEFISRGLIDLYKLCEKYDQTLFPRKFENGVYCYATRVFKVYAYVDPWILDKMEHAFFEGMYWPIEGAFLSRSVMENYFDKCYNGKEKHVMTPEEIKSLGLPDDLDYTFIKKLPNGMGFTIKKDNETNSYLRSRNCYEFLELRKNE